MIYMTTVTGLKIIVLEKQNIESILAGKPAVTQDKSVLIAFTPDPVWLADKIMDTDGDATAIAKLIDEGVKRPQKPPRPHRRQWNSQPPGKRLAASSGLLAAAGNFFWSIGMPFQAEYVITVDSLPPEDRAKFLEGFLNTFSSSKLSFEPPYGWDIRPLTETERKAMEGANK